MFSFDQDFVSRRTRDSTIIRGETIIKIRYHRYVHGKAVAVTQKGSVYDARQSVAFFLAIAWHLLFAAPDILRGLNKHVIKNTHKLVSSDSLHRRDSVVCHWTSKSEAKLVMGVKEATPHYSEGKTFIRQFWQWLKLWSWTESQSWAVRQTQDLGNGVMHDKQMNRLGFESSAFWVRWADPVLIPRKKSDK